MQISWDHAVVYRQLWQCGSPLGQAHTAIPAPSLSVLAEKSSGPYRCLEKNYFSKHKLSFCSLVCTAKLLKFTAVLELVCLFFFLSKHYPCCQGNLVQEEHLDSLHMAPVAKETPDDACRPLCRAPSAGVHLEGWDPHGWNDYGEIRIAVFHLVWYHESPKHLASEIDFPKSWHWEQFPVLH